ncbi:MAG: S-layer homology domain-containing protein [Gammaproteobacteria bacterium]|nr:S-layer homology domain-containing protein [Gammaproteobacteria bacterium]
MHSNRRLMSFFLLASLLWNTAGAASDEEVWGGLPPPLMSDPPDVVPNAVLETSGGGFADQVMELVNEQRWNNGALPPLKRNDLLDTSATGHSTNMGARNFFSHCDLDTNTSPGDRAENAGYHWNYVGENIAAGQSTPESVMNTWMNSSGHRANILSSNYRELGIGYYQDSTDAANVRLDQDSNCVSESTSGPFYYYWTQAFGRRDNIYPLVIDREQYQTNSRYVDLYLYGSGTMTEMRFHNENGAWTSWQPFSANVADWQLSSGEGMKEVFAEMRTGTGTVYSASDTILVQGLTGTFDDVPQSYWAYASIEAIAAAGITGGCGGGNYCPTSNVTRAQMAVFLLRGIYGSAYIPPTASGTMFNDVPKTAFAADWIEQLALEGITGGCGSGNYCPDSNITRAQMAVFLLRALYDSAYIPPTATGTMFSDVPKTAFAAAWIEQLVREGITGGCGTGIYCPDAPVKRDQMAVFLARTFDLLP